MFSFWNMTIDDAGNRYFQVSEGSFYLDFCLGIIMFCAMFIGSVNTAAKIEKLEQKVKSDKVYIQWLHQHSNENVVIVIPGTQPKGPAAE